VFKGCDGRQSRAAIAGAMLLQLRNVDPSDALFFVGLIAYSLQTAFWDLLHRIAGKDFCGLKSLAAVHMY
jgi:hypothetical protein